MTAEADLHPKVEKIAMPYYQGRPAIPKKRLLKMKTKIQKLKDGRNLAYAEYGNVKGIPVFYAHGGPGSSREGQFFHEVAIKYGFWFIATDRPGMGDSTYLENRTLLDYPRDISELADALDIDKFGVMGWSAGRRRIADSSNFPVTYLTQMQ